MIYFVWVWFSVATEFLSIRFSGRIISTHIEIAIWSNIIVIVNWGVCWLVVKLSYVEVMKNSWSCASQDHVYYPGHIFRSIYIINCVIVILQLVTTTTLFHYYSLLMTSVWFSFAVKVWLNPSPFVFLPSLKIQKLEEIN